MSFCYYCYYCFVTQKRTLRFSFFYVQILFVIFTLQTNNNPPTMLRSFDLIQSIAERMYKLSRNNLKVKESTKVDCIAFARDLVEKNNAADIQPANVFLSDFIDWKKE